MADLHVILSSLTPIYMAPQLGVHGELIQRKLEKLIELAVLVQSSPELTASILTT